MSAAIARLLAGRRRIDGERDVAAAFEALVAEGLLDLPLPGSGQTGAHHAALATIGAVDLSLARLAEGHSDARAILAELGAEPHAGASYGVWAAEPPGAALEAVRTRDGYRLRGTKRYASGARLLRRALVTARAEDGPRLFDADLGGEGVRAVPGTWNAVGMADSGSLDVTFDLEVPRASAIGGPNAYVARAGFEHGGVRVAACWFGGALGAARAFEARLRAKASVDAHDAASLGVIRSTCRAMEEVLTTAAHAIDADPKDERGEGAVRALHVRRVVEHGVTEVLAECGRAGGSSLLVFDRAHARRVADLAVYVRQHHGARDFERLGRLLLAQEPPCSP